MWDRKKGKMVWYAFGTLMLFTSGLLTTCGIIIGLDDKNPKPYLSTMLWRVGVWGTVFSVFCVAQEGISKVLSILQQLPK
jgi:hypothetical protein